METQNKPTLYEKTQGHKYVAPFNGPWDDDLWYYDVFYPKHLLEKFKSNYEKSIQNGGNTFKNYKMDY